ncbi:phosphoglycolate phosphatase [Azospirillum lipoferum]|uniref:HAD hydrolase-like protein n=1 Tax=Azospirillum lipoferum TaxID=193 RepID=A0A5A9GYA4_AZOLI|nr:MULTISPECIES: HAD hydrolase-like protein [Azospirillum]KAA0598772.1 HAD hydrolase-like protein [Azospirillum lipoferum]MCP1609196.1 phosphoglycolate phosphatase [Azospirillum lipoferum]MDW5535494.1 HAD hydrolase-like protein [Azospirillum sp. NL1]
MDTAPSLTPQALDRRGYRLAVFDFDGTLADSFPWFIGVLNGVADRYGFNRVRADEVERLRGYDARQIMRHLRVPSWKLPFIANHMRQLMARDIDGIRLFDGVPDMLRSLNDRGVTVAIVSSNSVENIRRILGAEVAGLVAHYGCGASLFGKAVKFRKMLGKTGVPADLAIGIGDEVRDIDAARKVGMGCAAVAWGYARGDALAARKPDRLLTRVEEIPGLFGG